MTNTKNTTTMTEELANKIDPSLYTKHVEVGAWLPKAKPFTYNYTAIDAVLYETYKDTTMKDISQALREPFKRVKYRVRILQDHGLLIKKVEYPANRVSAKTILKVSDVGQNKKAS